MEFWTLDGEYFLCGVCTVLIKYLLLVAQVVRIQRKLAIKSRCYSRVSRFYQVPPGSTGTGFLRVLLIVLNAAGRSSGW